GQPFIALEYFEGGSLAQKLQGKPQPPAEAARFVETLARTMSHAHEKGIIHRDLKPANILLDSQGQPHVTDFGLAKRLEVPGGQTKSGAIVGTPGYMAPEQARGETKTISPVTDVFALGVILYEMLTGRPPFQGECDLDTLRQVDSQDPVPPS